MLIQIERSRQKGLKREAGTVPEGVRRPSLVRSLWGGVTNLIRRHPLLAIFQVNLRCNSSCGYCNLPLNVGRKEMSREEIRHVFSRLYCNGLRLVFVQGGEPLLRRDLTEILQDLHEIGFHLTVITNGTRLSAQLVRAFSVLGVSISISLDTLDRMRYEQIRGADQLDEVLAGVALLRDYSQPKFMTCIVSEVNRGEVKELVAFARQRGFLPVVGAYHWDVGLYGKLDERLMYDRQQASLVFEQLLEEEALPPGYLRQYAQDNVTWLRGVRLSPCDAGRYSIAIDASGNVSPCLSLPAVGNLLKSSFQDIYARMNRQEIEQCSDRSSCNRVDGRIIGSVLRHPVVAWRTPVFWGG